MSIQSVFSELCCKHQQIALLLFFRGLNFSGVVVGGVFHIAAKNKQIKKKNLLETDITNAAVNDTTAFAGRTFSRLKLARSVVFIHKT